MVQAQKVLRLDGRVSVEIQVEDLHPRRDCDNCCKGILDLISSPDINIIAGDSAKHVRKVSAEWTDVSGAVVIIRRML